MLLNFIELNNIGFPTKESLKISLCDATVEESTILHGAAPLIMVILYELNQPYSFKSCMASGQEYSLPVPSLGRFLPI
jgi:hypothetical protein